MDAHEIAFEAFGVRVAVGMSDPDLWDRFQPLLPPGWRPCPPESVGYRFGLFAEDGAGYRVVSGLEVTQTYADPDLALGLLDSLLRLHIAFHAPHHIFIHAGAVAHEGRAIVLPGQTLSGKTTLVAALVRAGAEYYSDEYAVLDERGLVHPYPKPLSLRDANMVATDVPVDRIGGVAGVGAVPVSLIAVTGYAAGAEWNPQVRSAGNGTLALLANAVAASERPAQALAAARAACESALVLASERGEAADAAIALLEAAARIPS